MSAFVVWIDHTEAKLFRLSDKKVRFRDLKPCNQTRPIYLTTEKSEEEKENKLFQELADSMSLAQQILILGHFEVQNRFYSYLNQSCQEIASKVVACEVMDGASDFQIQTYAIQFFNGDLQSSFKAS